VTPGGPGVVMPGGSAGVLVAGAGGTSVVGDGVGTTTFGRHVQHSTESVS